MPPARPEPALVVVLAGVCAALHVGKLAPALPALQAALGLSLLQAGFLLSAVQGAGMALGLAFGTVTDGLGARRSMVLGLGVLSAASLAGAAAQGVALLMALRLLEGLGFLLVALPAPGLVRRLSPPGRTQAWLGVWSAYMPLATALALLLGPLCVAAWGWRAWWALLALLPALMAAVLLRAVPADKGLASGTSAASSSWAARLRLTLSVPGPWLVSVLFALYSAQWLAVIGFLPSVYAQAGMAPAATGLLSAGVAAANIVGNVVAGRALQRGVAARRLLLLGFCAMALAAAAAFAGQPGLAPPARYAALLAFSSLGGLVPATLFALAVRVAPGEQALGTTVGWMQQWSSLGQFAGPPAVAAVAAAVGGWQFTWVATGGCCLVGMVLAAVLTRRGGPAPRAPPVR